VPISAANKPSLPAFPWRRVLIALWVSAAVHLALMSSIRITQATSHPHDAPLQIRLDSPDRSEVIIPMPKAEVSADALETVPLLQTEVSADATEFNPTPKPDEPELPHLDLPQLADTTYCDVLALDSPQLQPVGKIEPIDPEADSANPHTGFVKLELKLEADGRVSDATVLETNLPPAYEKSAVEAFGKARFQPARRNGQPVRARFKVELTFKLDRKSVV
jgi:protein TonB